MSSWKQETALVSARSAAQCPYVDYQGLRDRNKPEGEPTEFPQLFAARAIFLRRAAREMGLDGGQCVGHRDQEKPQGTFSGWDD